MPEALERKLKKEYGSKSDIPYKIMNKLGVMHGNKETAKGKALDKKIYLKGKSGKKYHTSTTHFKTAESLHGENRRFSHTSEGGGYRDYLKDK